MTARIVTPPQVEKQIRAIDDWWRENRQASPDLFIAELAAGFELLGGAPFAGRRYAHPGVSGVRRLLLRSSRYHVYYKVHDEDVIVLAVWSALRGTGPDLSDLA